MAKVRGPHAIKVGDTLYIQFDYRRHGEEEWKPAKIIGETKASWILEPEYAPVKCNKKTMSTVRDPTRPMYYTHKGMIEKQFCDKHARDIASVVSVCDDVEKLKAIATILGMELK